MNKTYKLKSEFFFSNTATSLQLINVASDDALIYRFTGPCRQVFRSIAAGQSLPEIKQTLMSENPQFSEADVDKFLANFIQELTAMDVFDS